MWTERHVTLLKVEQQIPSARWFGGVQGQLASACAEVFTGSVAASKIRGGGSIATFPRADFSK
jgi:hypothetical protein